MMDQSTNWWTGLFDLASLGIVHASRHQMDNGFCSCYAFLRKQLTS
jgi:hypothetical protein